MMGKDVERILSGINDVKDATISSIKSLSSVISYQIISDATHGGISTGKCEPTEKPVSISASSFTSPIRGAMGGISSDCGKMNSLSSGLYTSTTSFNNSYGSPWTELNKLEEAISMAESYGSIDFVGQKSGLLGLLNMVLSVSIDAKWALTTYHDYIQRGYDNKYNDNTPSITTKTGIDKESDGNSAQEFEENVHIKKPSIDPF